MLTNENSEENENNGISVSSYRTSVPQVLATSAQSLLMFSLGMVISSPTIVIGALHKDKSNPESFFLTDDQASWFVGLIFIFEPVGSLISALIQDRIGRKKCMILVNIPEVIGWLLIAMAESVSYLFTAAVLLGFSVGFMEAPTLAYIGEISQPHLRGSLAAFTTLAVASGHLLMYLLGSVMTWRNAHILGAGIPVFTIIAILLVPESPVWLLMKNRRDDALKSLQWLRGWVSEAIVTDEFNSLERYIRDNSTNHAYAPVSTNGEERILDNSNKFKRTIKYLFSPVMSRPLTLITLFFFFSHGASMNGSRPYVIKIFTYLKLSLTPHYMTVLAGSCQIFGSIICLSLIKRLGKRKLSLISMAMASSLCFSLGIYSTLYDLQIIDYGIIPTILFSLIYFCANLGILNIPWALLSEVFPSRGRGLGGGISAAFYYILFFIFSKTFLNLQNLIKFYGICYFYGLLGIAGTVYLYLNLPETEGSTLKDIENYFNGTARNENPRSINT